MIRKLMASSAIAALVTAGALTLAQAQTEQPATEQPAAVQPAEGTDQGAAPAADQGAATAEQGAAPAESAAPKTDMAAGAADETLTPDEPTIASAFMGQSVFSSQEPESDNIGEVNDLIIGDAGTITHAVIGVGGFLGIGEKNVAVPFDQLQVVEEEDGDIRLIYAATKEQLEAAEAFDRTAYDPRARAAEEQAAATDAGTAPLAGTDPNAPAADQQMAAGADPNAPAVDQQPAQQDIAAAPAAEGEQVAAAAPVEGFVNFSADQVRASTLIGQELYGAENESIGEVSDLILQDDGKTRAALIDVGGFLGIGEKRVAIPFGEIKMMQPADMQMAAADPAAPATTTDPNAPAAAADPNAPAATTDPAAAPAVTTDPAAQPAMAEAEPRLTVAMTREQLEQLPEWEDPATRAAEAQADMADQNMAAGTDPNAPAATDQTNMAAADPNAPAADQQMAADPNAPASSDPLQQQAAVDAQSQYQPLTTEVSAENLMGTRVYGQNEEDIGEVGDVVFDPQGAIQAVVVDVGGFLGIGEKPVAIQYDALNVQKNGNGDLRLMINATQEQLQNAPSYDVNASTAQQTTVQ